jgi:hypothetical protein
VKKQKRIILAVVLVCIVATGGALTWLKGHQRLGKPGIKAVPRPGTIVMTIGLPERVLDFTSTNVPQSKEVLDYLPKDTSFSQRYYENSDGNPGINANIILMGADRTSIHRPEYCMLGQGWSIGSKTKVDLTIGTPCSYRLPVMKWDVSTTIDLPNGQKQELHGLYVFWFVADNKTTTHNLPLQLYMMRDLLFTGVLQRWAYISYFSYFAPGQEDAAFERMKKLIVASVPEFQSPPSQCGAAVAARQ